MLTDAFPEDETSAPSPAVREYIQALDAALRPLAVPLALHTAAVLRDGTWREKRRRFGAFLDDHDQKAKVVRDVLCYLPDSIEGDSALYGDVLMLFDAACRGSDVRALAAGLHARLVAAYGDLTQHQ